MNGQSSFRPRSTSPRRWFFGFLSLVLVLMSTAAVSEKILDIKVKGNGRVEANAIKGILSSKVGTELDPYKVKNDILALYNLKYFSDIKIYREPTGGGSVLVVEVKEKPAIVAIEYAGLKEITKKDIEDKIDSRVFSIVNESTITSDVRKIEKMYLEKGYYLASCSYELTPKPGAPHEVVLRFNISEGGKVNVGDVFIVGNKYFTDGEIIDQFVARPLTRSTVYATPGSLYNDDFVLRDQGFLGYMYKDRGFAEVKVAKPVTVMDTDREFVRLTYEVEEGIQYKVGKIDVTGDLLYTKKYLLENFQLKPGELFRISRFQADIEFLIDKYGDKGYAFVDVNPQPKFNRAAKTVDITYDIKKGDKVYFGEISIVGNVKTRDNVIRRELEIADGELYSGTGLSQSRRNITRLGFFEEVKAIRERDPNNPKVLNYKFKVKEKATGQLQAALGFSPGSSSESNWFGQGSYLEENQSGRGWRTNLSVKWNGENNYNFSLGFTEPRFNDGPWSVGFSLFFRNEVSEIIEDIDVQNRSYGGDITIGRKIIEKIRGAITYELEVNSLGSKTPIDEQYKSDGLASSLIFALFRYDVDNNLDPTEGSKIDLSQRFTGGILGGDQDYMESSASAHYYYPIDFSETYRTYFHIYSHIKYLATVGDSKLPFTRRYRLGGPRDLRAYRLDSIGHKKQDVYDSGNTRLITEGGDKEFLFQLEYFFPIIKEVKIKGLLFTDLGNSYYETEDLNFSDTVKDLGFGFRWITPVAPFRFEWAYPYEDGDIGDPEFVFYLGN